MTKVKLHESPKQSEQNKPDNKNDKTNMTVVDTLGRTIKLKSPSVLDEYDLNIALGGNSTNLGAVGMAIATLYVEEIDGVPFNRPTTAAQIRAALSVLKKEGLNAAVKGAQEYGLIPSMDTEEAKESIKKLSEINQ